jgi:hypothetical protein
MDTPPHMRVAEFAARMDMDPRIVRRRIKDGQIRALNIATEAKPEYRISEAELARWVEANQVTPSVEQVSALPGTPDRTSEAA